MRVLTINELLRLTRIELCDLAQRITNELPTFPEGSPERAQRAHQPAQHPLRAGAARLLAVTARQTPRMRRMRGLAAAY